jgi:hypothetical protein
MTLMMIEQLNERSTKTGAADFWLDLINTGREHIQPEIFRRGRR